MQNELITNLNNSLKNDGFLERIPPGLSLQSSGCDLGAHLEYVGEAFKRQRLSTLGEEEMRAILTPVIFAGVGSTGFAALNGIGRNVAPYFAMVLDLDVYSLSNLPRQMLTHVDVGADKAFTSSKYYEGLLPYSSVFYSSSGVNNNDFEEQMAFFIKLSDTTNDELISSGIKPIRPIIFDSIDVTTAEGWRARFALHEVASRANIHVVGAFDIGNSSLVFDWPYERGDIPPFYGKLNIGMLNNGLSSQDLNLILMPKILRVIPKVPLSYAEQYIDRARVIADLGDHLEDSTLSPEEIIKLLPGMPQERIAGSIYEAVVTMRLRQVLNGDPIPKEEYFDIEDQSKLRNILKVTLLFLANRTLIQHAGRIEDRLNNLK